MLTKTFWGFLSIVVFIYWLLFTWYVWPTPYKDTVIKLGDTVVVLRINRFTSQAEILSLVDGWFEIGQKKIQSKGNHPPESTGVEQNGTDIQALVDSFFPAESMPKTILDLRGSLSLTNEEENYLKEWNYIKSYLDSTDETKRKGELERIKAILEKFRCQKNVVEGIFVGEEHGANGGGFKIKTENGDIRDFYWSGSWGHPTLIMKNSLDPLELKEGEKLKVYFCEKTTALGIFKV